MAGIIGWIGDITLSPVSAGFFRESINTAPVGFSIGELGDAMLGIYNVDPGFTHQALLVEQDFIISADADLYNTEELKEKLELERSRKWTQAEIILQAFQRWGKECIHQLHGDFAFAIWNEATHELFCARDPIGIRPFYYSQTSHFFLFSSELRFIKKLYPGVLKMDADFFHDTLVGAFSDKHLTAFHSIKRLPPASYLTYRNNSARLSTYWTPVLNKAVKMRNPQDYADMLKEKIQHAVHARIQHAGKIGAELSGGLDSSMIACVAFNLCTAGKTPFSALSNVLPATADSTMKDEREFIHFIVENRKMPWIEISDSPDTIMDILMQHLSLQGSFVQQRFGMLNQELYRKAAANGIRVLLSGFGGDELVSSRLSIPWNDMIAGHQWKALYSAIFSGNSPWQGIDKVMRLLVKYLFWNLIVPENSLGSVKTETLVRQFRTLGLNQDYALKNKLEDRFFEKRKHAVHKFLSARQYQYLNHPHLPQRLEYCYSSAARYNIQYRYPLLDIRVIESYLSIPAHVRYGSDGNRTVFRMSMNGIVPEIIRSRNDKSGMTIPYYRLKPEKDKELIRKFIQDCSTDTFITEVFDLSKFPVWLDKIIRRDRDDESVLMPGAFYSYLMMISYFKHYGFSGF